MNKSELIEFIAETAELPKAKAAAALEAALTGISTSLQKGESVALLGFGSFLVAERAARTGRNPANGEELQIPACRQAKFRPGKALKDSLK